MRIPNRVFVKELEARFGTEVKLSWNEDVGRWQFDVLNVDGQYRPQFLQWTHNPKTGQKLKENEFGLLPFKELTDEVFREVCRNLERTYLANPADGGRTVKGHIRKIRQHNDGLARQYDRFIREESRAFFLENHRRATGGLQIQVVSPVGTPKEA